MTGLLGAATVVDARTGRKLNNALTLTFKTSESDVLATGAQAGSVGVLLGFKNGGDAGRFTLTGPGGSLALDCRASVTAVADAAGEAVGTITREADEGVFRDGGGSEIGRLACFPKERQREPIYEYPLSDEAGSPLGVLTLLTRAVAGTPNLLSEIYDEMILWDKPAPLKAPSFGTRLALTRPVDGTLGELLLSACVTMALGPQAFLS